MNVIPIVKNLGFTEYEAKAYVALLEDAPVTGYAAAKNSGVPRSKIYEVLESLTAQGYVLVSPGNPPLYRPLPARELIAARRKREEENLRAAEAALTQLETGAGDREHIWSITGADAIFRKVRACVDAARTRVLLEIWAEDFPALDDALRGAAARGVRVTLVTYGTLAADYAEVYTHEGGGEMTDAYGGRWIVFSADDNQIVAGTVSLGEGSRAAWTRHPGLVMPITEVILHDLYIAEMLKTHRDVLEARFGPNLSLLRQRFSADGDLKKHYIE